MSNIFSGRASEDEVRMFVGGRPMVTVYAKNKDNPNEDGDYPFWGDIKHPDTGHILRAVKGYCAPSSYGLEERPCYYAEYRDEQGASYYYMDSRHYFQPELKGELSIAQQISQDQDAAKLKFAKKDSFDALNDLDQVNKASHNVTQVNGQGNGVL